MALIWTLLSIFSFTAVFALIVLRQWGVVTAELEQREQFVYGESLASLARQEAPTALRLPSRPKVGLAASIAKR